MSPAVSDNQSPFQECRPLGLSVPEQSSLATFFEGRLAAKRPGAEGEKSPGRGCAFSLLHEKSLPVPLGMARTLVLLLWLCAAGNEKGM